MYIRPLYNEVPLYPDNNILWFLKYDLSQELSKLHVCFIVSLSIPELPTCHFQKSIIELKKPYFEVKKSILRAKRASRARSSFARGPGPA